MQTTAAAPLPNAAAAPPKPAVPLQRQLTWWALAVPLIMIVAVLRHNFPLLNWIHVLAGTLWTGSDIFMGFLLGPVMRRLEIPQRAAVIAYLVPRTLLYFPCMSLTTSTAGWFLASWLGYETPGSRYFAWIVAALVLVTVMTIIGLGIMLPNSLRIWFELQKPVPDRSLMIALNRYNIMIAGAQGLLQVTIIVVMSHLAVG